MKRKTKEWQEGYDARRRGRKPSNNPYKPHLNVDSHSEWDAGWSCADVELSGWESVKAA